MLWPMEGLLTLRGVIGYPDPRIRRAVVRVLAEAFNRHPSETLWFLNSSGAAVSDEDLIEIKIRQDARIGRRQINEEEWARIGHFLFSRPGARKAVVDCALEILRAGIARRRSDARASEAWVARQDDRTRHQIQAI